MNPLKKQTKLAIGISIIVLSIALIAAIIIFALNTLTKSTVLFGKLHNAVSKTVVDGVYISNYKGDYVLVRGDDIISHKYTFLAPTEVTGKYYFSDNSGSWGIVDNSGKELKKVKSNGNALQTDVFEYYLESRGAAAYYDESKKELNRIEGDEVYHYSEFETIGEVSLSDMPSGLVYYKKGANYYLESFLIPGAKLSCSETGATFTSSTVTFMGGEGAVTYSLSSFTEIIELKGAGTNEANNSYILADNENKKVLRVNYSASKGYSISFASKEYLTSLFRPTSAYIGKFGFVLKSGTEYEYIVKDAEELSGKGKTSEFSVLELTNGTFYRVGDKLLDSELKTVVSGVIGSSEVSKTAKNTIIAGGKVFNSTDGITLTLKLENAYETGKFFITEGRNVYNDSFTHLFTAEGVQEKGDGLFVAGGAYYDQTGKRVEDVNKVFRADKYSDKSEVGFKDGKWLFLTNSGDIKSFNGLEISKDNVEPAGEIIKIFELSNSVLAVGTKGVVNKDGDFESIGGIKDMSIFERDRVVVASDNSVITLESSSTDIKRVDSYNSYNCKIIKANRYGVVFGAANNMQGIIGTNGKILVKPMYKSIVLQNNFAVAETNFGTTRFGLINLSGKAITDFEYIDKDAVALLLNDSVIVKKVDGTYSFVNSIGKEVLKNITGFETLSAVRFDDELGKYVPDSDLYYALYIGEGIRMLKYPSVFEV